MCHPPQDWVEGKAEEEHACWAALAYSARDQKRKRVSIVEEDIGGAGVVE